MSTNHHTDIAFSASVASATVNLPLGQLDEAIVDLQIGDLGFTKLNLNSFTAKTIASGAIVGDASTITVDTEASAASDNLDDITGLNAGDIIYLKIANASRVVVVRNNGGGTGTIRTPSGTDITLNSVNQIMMLIYNGSTLNAINDPTIATAAPTDATYITQTSNGTLSAEQALSSLSTGLMKVTTATGVISTAVLNTDYSLIRRAIIRDEKSTGTAGGGSTAGAWNARDLNTEFIDANGIVAISSNQFTPISGTYFIHAVAPGFQCGFNRLRLYNVTATSSIDEGVGCQFSASDSVSGLAHLRTSFTANGTDAYRIDHYTSLTKASNGLGQPVSDGTNEVYLEIYLEKVA